MMLKVAVQLPMASARVNPAAALKPRYLSNSLDAWWASLRTDSILSYDQCGGTKQELLQFAVAIAIVSLSEASQATLPLFRSSFPRNVSTQRIRATKLS